MDCKEFSNLLDVWLEGALPDDDAARMQAHAAACRECAMLLKVCQDSRRADEEIAVPEAFSSAWRHRIREESQMEETKEVKKTRAKKAWKGWVAAAAAFLFLVGGTLMTREDHAAYHSSPTVYSSALGSSAGSYQASSGNGVAAYGRVSAPEAAMELMDYEVAEEAADAGGDTQARAEKIIRSASFTIRTTAYDQDLQSLQDLTAGMGGRVEYLSASGDAASGQTRSASLTLRIPAQRLDDFLSGAQAIGNVTALTQEMEDVSDSYYDIQTRLETQREKLARLQSMIASASKVSDLIEIEGAIADAQYYIDRYTSQLKGYDSKVDYSTVRVSLREIKVEEAKELSLGQRIWAGLSSSLEDGIIFLQDMLIFVISALPWLLLIAFVILVVRILVKRHKKNRKDA